MRLLEELKCKWFGHKLEPLMNPGFLNVGVCVRNTKHAGCIMKMDWSKTSEFSSYWIKPEPIGSGEEK